MFQCARREELEEWFRRCRGEGVDAPVAMTKVWKGSFSLVSSTARLMETVRLTWSSSVAVRWMKRKLSLGYCSNSWGILMKSFSSGNTSPDIKARGQAGRHMACEKVLAMMTW